MSNNALMTTDGQATELEQSRNAQEAVEADQVAPEQGQAEAGNWMDDKRAMFTSAKTDDGSNEYGTPARIWRPLGRTVGGWDLDPFSGAEASPIAPVRFTKEDDGLAQPWDVDGPDGNVDAWTNPPYEFNADAVPKARDESLRDGVRSVFVLIPNRSSTKYYQEVHDDVFLKAELGGRVDFDGDNSGSGAPFPVICLVFAENGLPNPQQTIGVFQGLGSVSTPVVDDTFTQPSLTDF